MLLCFTLGMPQVGSADGQWSGEGNLYAQVVNVGRSRTAERDAAAIIKKSPFMYAFGDGWIASVAVRRVDGDAARAIRKQSCGFHGYGWMIDSIRRWWEIRANPPEQTCVRCPRGAVVIERSDDCPENALCPDHETGIRSEIVRRLEPSPDA